VNGAVPLYLGTDDYFLERAETPVGPDGKRNYEDLEALDIEMFNRDMNDLLAGREVDLPEYDFITGRKAFGKRKTSVMPGQPIVIEGIHALNDRLTEYIDDDEKCRIYISPLTRLSVDLHSRVSAADTRLLRRIVRDHKYRGRNAAQTIEQWPRVRAGENKNIFPYNGAADIMFDSHLVYELAVIKKYAEPLLKEVKPEEPEYSEAVRLLNFIGYFAALEDEKGIPHNSIMREFIGGSIFAE
jgi:uridine kinase